MGLQKNAALLCYFEHFKDLDQLRMVLARISSAGIDQLKVTAFF